MFTQSCFIRKNTPELIEKLKNIGYKYNPPFIQTSEVKFNLICEDGYVKESGFVFGNFIDCGTNEDLFLAIAALRDDTDKNQWFTDIPGHWYICPLNEGWKFVRSHPVLSDFNAHKATVNELIKHFNK